MLEKWFWVSVFKMLVHPALLPVALATFLSVAGPGGVAEIGHNVSAVPTVTIGPDSVPSVTDERPAVLLVRVVDEETPVAAAPAIEADTPEVVEIADESLGTADEAPTTIEVPAQIAQPAAADVPSVHDDEPPTVDPSAPEEPVDTDESDCDPPGTGPEPHEGVPPGQDQNGDGIDDRC